MARVTKEPEVRRDELLDVALDLCTEVGFEAMSVEQVTSRAGVAKGTFYHYFSSKQDLLVQLVDRFGDSLFDFLESQMAGATGSGLDQMQALMVASGSWKIERLNATLSYLPFLFKEENYALRHKLFSAWLERTRPIVRRIIDAGDADGSFSVADANGAAEIVLTLWFDAANRMWERAIATPDEAAFIDVLVHGTRALWEAEERVLGAPEGSLEVKVDPSALVGVRSAFLQEIQGQGAGSIGDGRRS